MGCQHVQEQLSAYLEDELEPAARRSMDAHLEECVHCRRELEALRRTISALQSLEEIDVPPRLTAAIQAGIAVRERSGWRRLGAWLFFPMHIKLPLEAMALLLVTLGVVYVYRSAPELAQAPRPQEVAELESREKAAPGLAGRSSDLQEEAAGKRPIEQPGAYSVAKKKEQDALGETGVAQRSPRQEAPAAALRDVSLPEITLKTADPSQAASRIATIVDRVGGKVLETRGEHQFVLAIPHSSYPKFVDALRELGEAVQPPAGAPSSPPPEGTVTFSLRLIP